MRRMIATASRLILAVAFAAGTRAVGEDSSVRAEVRQVALTRGAPRGDLLAALELSFDLHISNGTRRPLRIPETRARSAGSERAAVLGVDSKLPDLSWVNLLRTTWVGNGNERYEACVLLPPGSEGDVSGIRSGFLLLKEQLRSLGDEPTLRLQIMLSCKQPGGRVLTEGVTTEEFRVRLVADR
jgi:hypothetical protein